MVRRGVGRVLVPVVCGLLLAGCSSSTPGDPAPAQSPPGSSSAAPTTASGDPAAPTATVELAGDPRADRDGEYEVTGSPDADTTCDAGTEQVTVEVRNPAPGDEEVAYVYLRAPVGSTPGPGTVIVEFQSEDFGTSYDSDYMSSDGRTGSATSQATVDGDEVTVTFEATIWDGATLSGTASCTAVS
jgi:hypothetical protein